MKRLIRVIPMLCALLLLAAGACLPHLAGRIADYRLSREVVRREDARISLPLSRPPDLLWAMQLFSARQSQIELKDGYRMTREEVQRAALEAAIGVGLIRDNALSVYPEITPMLLVSRRTPDPSGVFWRCQWGDGVGESLWLDDISGKMVAFQRRIGTPFLVETDETLFTIVTDPIQEIEAFCRLYYPVRDVQISENGEEDYTLTFIRDGGDESLAVSVRRRAEWLYFNL